MKFTLLSILSATQAAVLAKRDTLLTISYYAGPDCAPQGACGIDCAKEDTISLKPGDTWNGFSLPGTNAVHSFKLKWNNVEGEVGLRAFEKCSGWSKLVWSGDETCVQVKEGVDRFQLEAGHDAREDPITGGSCKEQKAKQASEATETDESNSDKSENVPDVDSTSVATFKPDNLAECEGEWTGDAVISKKRIYTGHKPIIEEIRKFREHIDDYCQNSLCLPYSFEPVFFNYGKPVHGKKVTFHIETSSYRQIPFFMDLLEQMVEQEGVEDSEMLTGSAPDRMWGGPAQSNKQYRSPKEYNISVGKNCREAALQFKFKVESEYSGEVDWCEIGAKLGEVAGNTNIGGGQAISIGTTVFCELSKALKKDDDEE